MTAPYQMTRAKPAILLTLAALVILWALFQGGVASLRDGPLAAGELSGPDSYMRLVRVTELAQGGDWFDSSIVRANAPYGDVLHWTRPFDVLILALALPARLVVEADQAIYLAGFTISPLLSLLTALLLVWALRPVISPAASFLSVVVYFLQPAALSYSTLGRADHHSLLILVFVVVAGFTLRALANPPDSRSALLAGIATGFGMWLSVEFLLPLAVCLVALGFPWLLGQREKTSQNKWFALGLSGITLIALVAERPFSNLLDPSYDRISSVHYLLAVSILVFWQAMESLEQRSNRPQRLPERIMLGLLGAGTVGLLLFAVYPLFFAGPMAEVDPRIAPIWLDRVLEMLPLIPNDRESLGRLIFYLGAGVLTGLPFLWTLLQKRGSRHFPVYLFVLFAALLFTFAALRHLRFAVYAETAYVLAIGLVLDYFLFATRRIGNDLIRGAVRGGFISIILITPVLVGTSLMAEPAAAKPAHSDFADGCDVQEVARYLETDSRWSQTPMTVLTFMDIGPELLYRTRHRVVGTPYHRNARGILDGYEALAGQDPDAAQRIFNRRDIDLVLLCRSEPERAFYKPGNGEENLYLRLDRGDPPSWLALLELPPALDEQVRLYRVLR